MRGLRDGGRSQEQRRALINRRSLAAEPRSPEMHSSPCLPVVPAVLDVHVSVFRISCLCSSTARRELKHSTRPKTFLNPTLSVDSRSVGEHRGIGLASRTHREPNRTLSPFDDNSNITVHSEVRGDVWTT